MSGKHPLVVDPQHPLVERVRAICMTYPEVTETEAWGRPTFKAGKKVFVFVGASMEHPLSIVVKPDPDARLAYLQDSRFTAPAYWGPSGWLAIDVDSPHADWTEFAELIDDSYRGVALVRQLRALDQRPASATLRRHR